MEPHFTLSRGGRKRLIEGWNGLLRSVGVDPEPHFRVLEDLFTRYAEPQRAYHNLAHVETLLYLLPPVHSERAALEFAVWFHDAVYDPTRPDNEEQSAELARQRLGELELSAAFAGRVSELVLATKSHQSPDPAARLLLDADLSILGQPDAVYRAYRRAIRSEYAWVPDELFGPRRVAVLESFLARPRIYHTEGFAHLEAPARANMSQEIAELAGAEPG